MQWSAVVLELGLLALGVFVLGLDLFIGGDRRQETGRALYLVTLAGLAVLWVGSFVLPEQSAFTPAWVQDGFALFLKRVFIAAASLTVLGTHAYASRRGWAQRSGEFLVLLLFTTIGAAALVSAREFLTLFVAFELLSLPLYALTALDKARPESSEGALKLFVFGSVSSAILLLGIGLLFASTGTTFWMEAIVPQAGPLVRLGAALLLVGFGFKVAMFPFYMWAPDTYESAPTPFVAFLSVAPKAAGIAALFRLYIEVFAVWVPDVTVWIAWIAALTMIVGNLLALPQQNLKRLLAYSGVAHIGYVLAALATGSRFGAGMALFYFVAYLFSNIGAFLAVAALESSGVPPTIDGVRNLVRRSPWVASAFLVFLLSLGGIPFVLGFWGKLYVFLAAGKAGLWWLVLLGALLAVVALYYYLNVARSMFIAEPSEGGAEVDVPGTILAAVLLCAVVVAVGGLVPQLLVEPALLAVQGF